MTLDPKTFYNNTMPGKQGEDYEHARWHATPLLKAQYYMMLETLERFVLPLARSASSVLEVGPGPGTWTKQLLRVNTTAQYTLLDISREMLDRARKALKDYSSITYVEEDLTAYAPNRSYDFFFSSRALEYMPDKKAALRVIAQSLSTGAYGAIVTKMPKEFFYKLRGRAVPEFHRGQISPQDLANIMRDAGLTVETVRVATATVPGLRSPLLNRLVHAVLLLFPLVPPLTVFAESYVVVFKKL